MLWEMKPDSQNILISGAIRRDQVYQVLQCLHFRDNTLVDGEGKDTSKSGPSSTT
jgi:hypothetical protein